MMERMGFIGFWLTVENSKFAGRSKMVRCKEAKKSRPRGVFCIHKRSGFFC
jgi:hypothetical protein